ncbi:hypothetical protein [Bathymodiolus platifrons methanotrophic gill symbiont]|uniref:hypothetical protein n=1 Tax=Bathymodiolus platifrons methanotrophic gill symbiont TaxID=113268 RepID=UPI001C8D2A8E|nr:hypothetical protein [Bathymodiolus platifrons methanotrophic gill symbiont]
MDLIIGAPLVGRWDVTESVKQLIDNGLIENFIEQVKPFITQEVDKIDENFRRELEWFYPYGAVRETLINALAHREELHEHNNCHICELSKTQKTLCCW